MSENREVSRLLLDMQRLVDQLDPWKLCGRTPDVKSRDFHKARKSLKRLREIFPYTPTEDDCVWLTNDEYGIVYRAKVGSDGRPIPGEWREMMGGR